MLVSNVTAYIYIKIHNKRIMFAGVDEYAQRKVTLESLDNVVIVALKSL